MIDQFFVYFSRLLDKPVLDSDGRRVGRVHDLAINLNDDIYPRARAFMVRAGVFRPRYAEVQVTDVASTEGCVRLCVPRSAVTFQNRKPESEFELRRDVLDQQIVDVQNKKVVRVNDVQLLKVNNQLYIAHVDVGLRGLVRRLDWEPVIDGIVRLTRPNAAYLAQEELVSWKNSQVLTLGSKKNVLKLDVACAKIAQIPPTALAEIMGDLDVFEQAFLFRSLRGDVQSQVFADMAADDKVGLIEQLDDKEASELLATTPSDEAADLLLALPKRKMHQLLKLMETQTSKKLRVLLGFRKDSAGGLMAAEYLWLPHTATVADAMAKVKESVAFSGSITTLYLVDDHGKYAGTTTIRKFINEDPARPIRELCHPQKVFVRTDDGMEEIALLLEQYKYSAIPVLDDHDVLVGSITIDDVMEELIALTWGKYKDQL